MEMSRQILLCVETNKKARTDYLYIKSVIKKYYQDDKKIIYRPVFMDSKTKYNSKDKVKEIKNKKTAYRGESIVIYFVDVDDYDISSVTKQLFDEIEKYCETMNYDFVYFSRDVEDVFLGNQIHDSDKVKKAEEFNRKNLIDGVKKVNLNVKTKKRHCSNIMIVFDKYWNRIKE